MTIFVPFKLLRAETWQRLQPIGARFIPLVDDFDYWHYFQERWAEAHSFINVEQDVVPTREQLNELASCPSIWCGFGYEDDEEKRPYFGCTKITQELMAFAPDVWRHKTHWSVCDTRMASLQGRFGFCHHGTVKHLESCNPFLDEDNDVIPTASLWQGGKDRS